MTKKNRAMQAVKAICNEVGADWETASRITIEAGGPVTVTHITQRDPVVEEVRTYDWSDFPEIKSSLDKTVGVSVAVKKGADPEEIGRAMRSLVREYEKRGGSNE